MPRIDRLARFEGAPAAEPWPVQGCRSRCGHVLGWLALLAFAACAAPSGSAESRAADTWIELFDGSTLEGWRATTEVDWHLEEGTLVATRGEVGLLLAPGRYRDFELGLEFRSAEGSNSGVFVRTPADPKDPARDCFEINIAPPENPFPTGSLVGRARVGDVSERRGWRRYRVTAIEAEIEVELDGSTVLRYRDPDRAGVREGYIGLQFNRGTIEFRRVRVRPIVSGRAPDPSVAPEGPPMRSDRPAESGPEASSASSHD